MKLWEAAHFNRIDVVRELLASGVDVDEKDHKGCTALVFAASYGHQEVAKALLTAGAKVDEKARNDITPLKFAVFMNHQEMVKLLLAAGARVDEKGKYGGTALLMAAKDGLQEIVKSLLAAGADLFIKSPQSEAAFEIIQKSAKFTPDQKIELLHAHAWAKRKAMLTLRSVLKKAREAEADMAAASAGF
jgi:ankyrin repeat protein